MARPQLSRSARADLVEIGTYSTREFGEMVANRYLRGIADTLDMLGVHPFAGAEQPAHGPAMRCFVYRRHRIFYRIADQRLLIVRILHHSRDAVRELPK